MVGFLSVYVVVCFCLVGVEDLEEVVDVIF